MWRAARIAICTRRLTKNASAPTRRPSTRPLTRLVKAASISLPLLAFKTSICTPSGSAAALTSFTVFSVISTLFGFRSTPRGDHAIHGKRGHIYPDGDGYLLCVHGHSARRWSALKRKLLFCQLRIDGDDEGTLHLDHLPPPPEAKVIRQVMAIRKRRRASGEGRPGLDHRYTPD